MGEKDRIKKDQKVIKDTDRKKKDPELMTEEERDQYFAELREKRRQRKLRQKRNARRKKIAVLGAAAVVSLVVVVGAVNGIAQFVLTKTSGKEASQDQKKDEKEKESQQASVQTDVLAEAQQKAAQYDYDAAIQLLKADSSYSENAEMQAAVSKYEETRNSCVSWPLEEVTHVFYHSLIKDPSRAFDGDYKEGDYNQVMTTIDEFNKITQTMYDKGYVMVSVKDMAKADADGNITRGEILLPPGKIPFVLSQDDLCYYHYMDGDGYASKLIVDDEGKIRNEYVETDGSISIGDYDMVPLIGGTDIIIFAFGTDLTVQEDYSGDKFEYLKSAGYNYFCNVDSSKYFVQIRDRYFRQGRRNLDGYRMYYNPELLEDLFDAKAVFDPSRPTPVPPMG